MVEFKRVSHLLSRFRDNEDGNMSVVFGVSAIALFGLVGAAMDFSTAGNAQARGQSIADQTALAAAVYVRDNGSEPLPTVGTDGNGNETFSSDTGYLDNSYRTYTAAELGYDFKGWVDGGAENVTVTVDYDSTKQEVTTLVSGRTKSTFMQLLGTNDTSFSASSTAKYDDYDIYDPASVLLVLDNSGSMAFDDKPIVEKTGGRWRDSQGNRYDSPDDARPRIAALRDSSRDFMQTLLSLVGDQTNDNDKVLRTGMLAYNETTINNRTVLMDWQTVKTASSIDQMVANGGTNSAPPVDLARIWMAREDNIHKNVHGEEPLKFMVFMTDGLNTDESVTWVEEEDTGQWRGLVTRCGRRRCSTNYEEVEQENPPSYGYNWTEGYYDSTANVHTLTDCTSMKEDGVKIYTIGFALATGNYDENEHFGNTGLTYQSSETRSQAYSFLAGCASDPSTFLTAENADQLKQAFTQIGADIQTEIIRLSN